MKKSLLSTLIVASLCMTALTGCGGSSAPAPSTAAPAATEAATQAATETAAPAAPAADSGDVLTIRLGITSADGSLIDVSLDYFAERVGELSDGKMKVEVYPNSQLGDNTGMAEQLQFGSLEMHTPSIATVAGFSDRTAIFDMPFLFVNHKAAADALNGGEVAKYVSEGLEEAGFHVLTYLTQGDRHITCNKEVHKPEDLKGLKIRTMESKYHMLNFNTYGASATPMAFSEVFTALQQGTIDAQENPYSVIASSKLYEVQKYTIQSAHIYDVCPMNYSKILWDKLTPEQQEILQQAADDTFVKNQELLDESDARDKKAIQDGGCTIIELTDEERNAFREASQPVYDQFIADYGDVAEELLAMIEKSNDKFR